LTLDSPVVVSGHMLMIWMSSSASFTYSSSVFCHCYHCHHYYLLSIFYWQCDVTCTLFNFWRWVRMLFFVQT